MGRRENFKKILAHEQPDDAILDLGGCPLSTMMGKSYAGLMHLLGLENKDAENDEILKWGQVYRLDDRLVEALDIDTRGVGAVQIPCRSTWIILAKNEYIPNYMEQKMLASQGF